MKRNNSKGDIKIVHAKLTNNNAHSNLSINTANLSNAGDIVVGVKTPSTSTHHAGLIERVMNIVSSATTGRKQLNSAERRIVSIDLKVQKKSSS